MASPVSQRRSYPSGNGFDYFMHSMNGYLKPAEYIAALPRVDREHRNYLNARGFPFAKELSVRSDQISALFRMIHKLSHLRSLEERAARRLPNRLVESGLLAPPSLTQLVVVGGICANTASLIEAIPNLKSLVVRGSFFLEGMNSEVAKMRLRQLTELAILLPESAYCRDLLELVMCSRKFQSIKINGAAIPAGFFREVAQNPQLTQLDLGDSPRNSLAVSDTDYNALSRITTLERFTPGIGITEAALIAILTANPNIIHLDLSWCPREAITGPVLDAIAALRHLKTLVLCDSVVGYLDNTGNVTDEKFLQIVRSCTQLESLSLGCLPNVSSAALEELRQCRSLRALKFIGRTLEDPVVEAFTGLIGLTALSLNYCSMRRSSLLKVQRLKNLIDLDLVNRRYEGGQDNPLIQIFVSCSRLRTLKLPEHATCECLRVIRVEMEAGRSNLRHLVWRGILPSKGSLSPWPHGCESADYLDQLARDFPHLKIETPQRGEAG